MPPKAPPRHHRFSHFDQERKIVVDAVYHPDKTIKYAVYDAAQQEIDWREEWPFPERNITYYPPLPESPALTKEKLILPELYGSPESVADWIARLNEEELTKSIQNFINEYLEIEDTMVSVLAAFVKFTWVHERSFIKPYLNIWGDKGTGKSSIAETALVYLCRYCQYYGGAVTPSALLRSVDEIQGTSILDESDFKNKDSESDDKLLRILRGGYKSTGTYALTEMNGKYHTPSVFLIGNPKVIISRQPIADDALRSRCLALEMKAKEIPAQKRKTTEQWFEMKRRQQSQEIVNRLLLYRFKHLTEERTVARELHQYEARLSDNAEPLWHCLVMEKEKEHFLKFFNENSLSFHEQMAQSIEGQILSLLSSSLSVWPELSVKDLCVQFKEKYKEDYPEKTLTDMVTPRKFSWRLKGMGITTTHRRNGSFINLSQENLKQIFEKYGVPYVTPEEVVPEM